MREISIVMAAIIGVLMTDPKSGTMNEQGGCFTVGDVSNCEEVNPLGFFDLPTIKTCENIERKTHKLETFKGQVLKYNPTVTKFSIFRCSKHFVITRCKSITGKATITGETQVPDSTECEDMIYE